MVDSVERISTALSTLAAEPSGLSVVDFSRRMQTSKASGSRLLAMLADAGLAERDGVTQQYSLGMRVFSLGAAALNSLHLVDFAIAPMVQTAKALGIPVSLNIQRGDKIVTLLRAELLSDRDVFVRPHGGETVPRLSATGPVFAAFGGANEPDPSGNGHARMEGVDPEAIRVAGYARHDFDWGFSVAAPVFNYTKRPVATISAQWRTDSGADVSEASIAAELKEVCRNLSRLLGYASLSEANFA